MRKTLLLALAIAAMTPVLAQSDVKLHSPAEILQMLTDSKVQYEIGILDKPLQPTDQSQNLNYNNVYRRRTDKGFSTVRYTRNAAVEAIMVKAEQAFANKNYDSARAYYLQALETDTAYYTVITYIGQTYGIQKNWEKAIEWYQKAIRSNYIDYMAHWFLADAYMEMKQTEEAKKEILIAHVLNRNNPRIRVSLNYILKSNGLKMSSWVFNPQYNVTKDADNKVKVMYGDGWLSYALTKAVWAHEPGYSQSMGYTDESFFRELEEKEALIGMIVSEDPKTLALPETLALQKATEDGKENRLQEFIFYEILLTAHPGVAFQLPDQLVEDIAGYILEIRCEKI